mmetsp:Transcript_21660/g.74396  ORF Transcript_21660/g.74396 Transcript_21660/m.74396 type:complete len:103 (-) Transcript_21660:540-848(-)|eukprot:CAMPEP_0203919510 /NCGR_PEP_ID=MMETSP0359-20131031/59909_1 /ASSEMBLY_ACC=CAM_ASM_000338 /TAXON_ID=268821 /ORGANISM="Scrippsiella Hangoei, Strain SHTV-5" /LENGTH=102 /DNA_ID=CAMNT_0050846813 /DNA_START=103 /DNA_END=411 /DNA_ORIENTATION=-
MKVSLVKTRSVVEEQVLVPEFGKAPPTLLDSSRREQSRPLPIIVKPAISMEEAISSDSGVEFHFRLERDRLSDRLGLRLADLLDPDAWEVISVEAGFIKEWN